MDAPANNPDWEHVKELLLAVEEESPENLDAWLEAKCDDPAVRQEVIRLLQASAAAGNFLEGSASERHLGVRPPHPARIGRYRIIEELGVGGLGVVYGAVDDQLHRPVALKVLQSPEYSSNELRKRLLWDARAACKLQHPNIVVVHDIGEDQGFDYVVMERVPGDTLKKAIPPGGMDPDRAIRIGLRILEGLEAAHNAGIVHRDLKPTNIMIGENDAVKLLDFGLAKPRVLSADKADAPKTIEGGFAGTAAYVSPEQAQGRQVDERGDIFSFGCVFFEMLTGRQAFEGESIITVVARIIGQAAPKLASLKPAIDPRLSAIVQRCLRKEPAERFQNVAELKQELAECQAPIRTPLPRLAWGHTGWLAWGLVGCLLFCSCLIVWFLARGRTVADAPYQLIRLSSDGELSEDPAISPDGHLIAYASDRESHSNLDLFVQDNRTGIATRVTRGPANAYQPVFSPDGAHLVFRSDQDGGGLYTIPTMGANQKPLLLADGGRDPRFSPNGKWLAFWTGEEGASMLAGMTKAMYIPATGGEAKLIAPDLVASSAPVWDPTGKLLLCAGRAKDEKVAFWRVVDFDKHVSVRTNLQVSSGFGILLREPAGSNWLKPIAWLPDQTVLAAAKQGDANHIWGFHISTDGNILSSPRRLTGGTDLELHAGGTLDAAQNLVLVYDALRVTTRIGKVELNSKGWPVGGAEPLVQGYGGMGPATLSRDGRKLLFSVSEPGRYFVYLKDLETGQVEHVANREALRSLYPMLSGDGNWMAYRERAVAYLMSVNGGLPITLCAHCGAPTDAGADGSRMLFESGEVTNQLLALTRDGHQTPIVHVVDAPTMVLNYGRWSEDGRWILFMGAENHRKSIYLGPATPEGNVQRSQLVRISGEAYDAWNPVWSSDNKHVYFIGNMDGYRCIWGRAIDPATGRVNDPPFPVAHFHDAHESIAGPLPSPLEFGLSAGGRLLVFTLAESSGEIWQRKPQAPSDQ